MCGSYLSFLNSGLTNVFLLLQHHYEQKREGLERFKDISYIQCKLSPLFFIYFFNFNKRKNSTHPRVSTRKIIRNIECPAYMRNIFYKL